MLSSYQSLHKLLEADSSRYLIVGGSAFAVEYLSFYLFFHEAKWQIYAANSLSFCLGLIISFTFNRNWTFKKANFKKRTHHQITLYFVLAAFNLAMINIVVGILKIVGLDPRIGKFLAMLMIVTWNFLIFRNFIFSAAESD